MDYLDRYGYKITEKAILFNKETRDKLNVVLSFDKELYVDVSSKNDLTSCVHLKELCGNYTLVKGVLYYQLEDFNIWNNDVQHEKIK